MTGLPPEHDPELEEVVRRLRAERPVPRPGFRGALRRRLSAGAAAQTRRLRLVITAYATSGLGLLLVAAIGLAGAGPFAA
jgi:hypothetical protein